MSVAKKEYKRVTVKSLIEMKQNGEKISMLTSYDYSMAKIVDSANVDVILVGDSASNVIAGHETTLPITLDQMIYHASSVVRAAKRALVIVDIPFGSYQSDSKEALRSAIRIMKESGAHAVKVEGGSEIKESVKRIIGAGIPVMGHLGLTPQSIYKFGTYTVRAKEEHEAQKLKDDAKIVEDSLLSLAKRVFVLSSFVTREVGEMNAHMDKSVEAIKDRKKPLAVSEQQFTMTSMNNLALLLDDVLQQMQENLADAMGKPQKGKGKQKAPSLGELQQQLNEQINELKQSGKSGRELSEELAKLAAEQQRIREALKEMQEKLGDGNQGSKPGDGIIEKMEETEVDLVNKQITQKTIQRQKEILTRLLEAEDAMRERDKDEERKAETGKDYDKQLPKAFEKYLKIKEQETELLKTIPPKLYPYYKKEVNEYFKRVGNEVTTESE